MVEHDREDIHRDTSEHCMSLFIKDTYYVRWLSAGYLHGNKAESLLAFNLHIHTVNICFLDGHEMINFCHTFMWTRTR